MSAISKADCAIACVGSQKQVQLRWCIVVSRRSIRFPDAERWPGRRAPFSVRIPIRPPVALARGRGDGLSVRRGRRAVGDRGASAKFSSRACFHRSRPSPPAFVRLTASGVLPHHAADTILRLVSRLRAGRRRRRRDRHRHGTVAPRRGPGSAARQHGRADPGHRLCAAVPALVRARQRLRRSAGRLRFGLSHHLQYLDRREGGEGGVAALGARHGRRRPPAVSQGDPAGRAALHPDRPAPRPRAGLAHPGRRRDAGGGALGPGLDDLRCARVSEHGRDAGGRRRHRGHRLWPWRSWCSSGSRISPSCAGG